MKTKKKSAYNNGCMTCEYCQAVKQEISFCIGASREPDWVMHEGTGKVSCPACWHVARQEGIDAIDKHIQSVNKR